WCRRQRLFDGGVDCDGWSRWPPNNWNLIGLDVVGSDVLVTHEQVDDCGRVLARIVMTTTLAELEAGSERSPRVVSPHDRGGGRFLPAIADDQGRIIVADGRVDVGSAWSVEWPDAGAAARTLALRRIAGSPLVVVGPPGRIVVARLGAAPGFDAVSGLAPELIPPNLLWSGSGYYGFYGYE